MHTIILYPLSVRILHAPKGPASRVWLRIAINELSGYNGLMMSPAAALDFSGKIVVVTGASGGLGAGIARVFAEAGARLALHYKDNRGKAETLRLSLPSPELHFSVQADGCDESSVGGLVRNWSVLPLEKANRDRLVRDDATECFGDFAGFKDGNPGGHSVR